MDSLISTGFSSCIFEVLWLRLLICMENRYRGNILRDQGQLTIAPILDLPDFPLKFELHSDALKLCIGSMLTQNGRLVAYFNEKLFGAKVRYST